MAFTVVKACAKLGIVGGAFYWSVQQGVWGTPHEGAEAMKRFQTSILSQDESTPKPKKVEEVKSNEGIMLASWNQGAKTVFEYIRDVPEYTGKATDSITSLVQDTFKS